MPSKYITVRGARQHNLKNIDLDIPKHKLVVISGVSGSGKSSLAFDTIYAEGQRRYVESLSAYARQFLGQMEKPKVEYVGGLSPAVSIEQKAISKNPRSTVGTITEISDYMRVLFARVGQPHCHLCGRPIGAQTRAEIIEHIKSLPEGTHVNVLAPVARGRGSDTTTALRRAHAQGYSRYRIDGRICDLSADVTVDDRRMHDVQIVVDRLVIRPGAHARIAEAVENGLQLGGGMIIAAVASGEEILLSQHLACTHCRISFEPFTPQMFSFNHAEGMCPRCEGLGKVADFDPDLVLDRTLTLRQGAVRPWGRLRGGSFTRYVEAMAEHFGFDIDTPVRELSQKHVDVILYGSDEEFEVSWSHYWGRGRRWRRHEGVITELRRRLPRSNSPGFRKWCSKFTREQTCPECGGARIRPESAAVRLEGRTIVELSALSIGEALEFFDGIKLQGTKEQIAGEVLEEVRQRLRFLVNVGLHYLTLDRAAATLSGGEAQRIRLASQIGSGLVGVLYILDEPTIGLHQRDTKRLISTLKYLRDLPNTILVIEHDLEMLRASDFIIDLGPGAGEKGGEVVATGPPSRIKRARGSITGQYLSGRREIPVPTRRRPCDGRWIELVGARRNNLKNLTVRFPVGVMTCVTGVSGSGKSSLVTQTLREALEEHLLPNRRPSAGSYDEIRGIEHVDDVITVDQSPIGKTPRSNPVSYIGAWDAIRQTFARLPAAVRRGYKPGWFSFNVPGGRCEDCRGFGAKLVQMHFLPDVWVPCETCKGARFNRETLKVRYKGASIADVLDMTVTEALEHFRNVPAVARKLRTLYDVGLGYVRLGQSSDTLSGGEAQRIKLAAELSKRSTGRTVYILDEPTTGLHAADVEVLLAVLNRLIDAGNTVIIIEHNLDVIKNADIVIDLGPEGGDEGGRLVATGTPEEVAACEQSYTGRYLRDVLHMEPKQEPVAAAG